MIGSLILIYLVIGVATFAFTSYMVRPFIAEPAAVIILIWPVVVYLLIMELLS